jgi:hypothetical protein
MMCARARARTDACPPSHLSLRCCTPCPQRLEEVSPAESAFYTAGQTLAAGNISGGKYMVQVFAGGVRVMRGLHGHQEMRTSDPADADGLDCGTSELRAAHVCDPFIVCHVGDDPGSLRLLRTCADGTLELVPEGETVNASVDAAAAVWIHRDASGDVAAAVAGRVHEVPVAVAPEAKVPVSAAAAAAAGAAAGSGGAFSAAASGAVVDDDDEAMLYATSSPVHPAAAASAAAVPVIAATPAAPAPAVAAAAVDVDKPSVVHAVPLSAAASAAKVKHFLFVLRASGTLQVLYFGIASRARVGNVSAVM